MYKGEWVERMKTCEYCEELHGNSTPCINCRLGNPCLGCVHYENDCEGQCEEKEIEPYEVEE